MASGPPAPLPGGPPIPGRAPIPGPVPPPPVAPLPATDALPAAVAVPAPLPHGVTVPVGAVPVAAPPPLHRPPRNIAPPIVTEEEQMLLLKNKGIAAQRNDHIIYGFVRCNYHNPNRVFPVEMIKLIIFFFDLGFLWTLNKKEIQLLQSVHRLVSVPVIVNETVFHYRIETDWSAQQLRFCLEMRTMPKNMECMMVYFELQLIETDHYYKETCIFGTYMPRSECKYAVTNIKDLHLFESMTFRGSMDILHVRYRSNDRLNADPRYMNLTKMRANCRHQWDVLINVLQLKSSRAPRAEHSMVATPFLYSDSFNRDVFSLYLEHVPANTVVYLRSKLRVGIKIYKLPNRVKRLLVSLVIICYGINGDEKYCIKKLSRRAMISCGWRYHINLPNINKYKMLQFKATIKTKKVLNYQEKEISRDEWKNHGILY